MSLGSETSLTMPVVPSGMYGGGGGGFGWGQDWIWIIVLFLFAGGWGNNGFGGAGANGGVGSEVQRGFDHSATVTKLDGITQGICDSTYALNNALMNGFHGVSNAICTQGYQTQQGFNALGAQLAQCCCDTQRAIEGVNYNMATQACETRHAIQDSTRQILDFLTTDKISTLQAENQALRFQASQTAQNGYIDAIGNSIVARLQQPVPVPSYIVPNPNAVYGCGCGACA